MYLILYIKYSFLLITESFIRLFIFEFTIFSIFQISLFSSISIDDNKIIFCFNKRLLLFRCNNYG